MFTAASTNQGGAEIIVPAAITKTITPAETLEEKPVVTLLKMPADSRIPDSITSYPLPLPIVVSKILKAEEEPSPLQNEVLYVRAQSEAFRAGEIPLPEPAVPEAREAGTGVQYAAADMLDQDTGAGVNELRHETAFPVETAEDNAFSEENRVNTKVAAAAAMTETEASDTTAAEPPGLPEMLQTALETGNTASIADRVISADKGEPVALIFDGRGWIYTPSETGDGAITLLARTFASEETIFEFDALEVGEYHLQFQFQDNKTGKRAVERVNLVVADAAPAIDNLIEAEHAADEPSPIFQPQNIGQALDDPLAAADFLPQLLKRFEPEEKEQLEHIALLYKNSGSNHEYLMCLEKYIEMFPKSGGNDIRYFELGRLYESDEFRNEKKARRYYAVIMELYPASAYYFDAEARVRYLDRHFFDLR